MNKITITVAGVPGSGKTMIQQWIAEQLSQKFKHVEIDWGIDGNPNRDSDVLENYMNMTADSIAITVKAQNVIEFQDSGVEE